MEHTISGGASQPNAAAAGLSLWWSRKEGEHCYVPNRFGRLAGWPGVAGPRFAAEFVCER